MAQLININSTEFRRCNLSAIQTGGTWASLVPNENEIILISTANALTADGSGNCDAYIVGNGTTVASALELKRIEELYTSDTDNGDLEISDENRNVLVRFSEGEVQTKNFNSKETPAVKDNEEYSDFNISDENGNSIVEFSNGHLRTKNFDSRNIPTSDSPTDYNGNDIHIFTSGVCIGDSMTAGTFNYDNNGSSGYIDIPKHSYPTKLSEMMGVTLTNKGVGGYTSVQWYDAMQNVDLSGNDFAIIQLGINDQSVYGGWTNASKTAFENIITKLKNENEGIKIFVATIIPAINYGGRSAISQGIRDLVEELDDDSVVLLDMAEYSHVGDNIAYSAGHLSAYGYFILARDYYNYISWHIANNKALYRFVQFIGTNYNYQ
jgi:lysophospholipase L1-like esterase